MSELDTFDELVRAMHEGPKSRYRCEICDYAVTWDSGAIVSHPCEDGHWCSLDEHPLDDEEGEQP
jgi:hypothetical protein